MSTAKKQLQVWRITKRKHARRAFAGEGARLAGGRWNIPGTAIVYTSASLSLAALELFVHLDIETVPTDLVAVSAVIPRKVKMQHLDAASLPRNWREYPALESLQAMGTEWTKKAETAVVSVPSAVIPDERNYLLNPAHPQFSLVTINRPTTFSFDPRMWK